MKLDAGGSAIGTGAQVYDIRGSYTQYQCAAQSLAVNAFANSHNCNKYVNTAAPGVASGIRSATGTVAWRPKPGPARSKISCLRRVTS